MIIVLKPDVTEEEKEHIYERIRSLGLRYQAIKGVERTVIGVIGQEDVIRTLPLEAMPGVERSFPILKPFKLASRDFKSEDTVIELDDVKIGGRKVVVAAGPCSVEGEEMILDIAWKVKDAGAVILRGGAFKPRTSPYSFQGYGEVGLKYLAEAREKTGLYVVTEVVDTKDIPLVEKYADILQVGTRNMSNFSLLKEIGGLQKPVLLKRGRAATVRELLMAAEHILSNGNMKVILCERGIRTFENGTRNTLDLSAVPAIKESTHLPVFVDPSHGTGKREYIAAMSKAAVAAGADGLLIEVHNCPEKALSDGEQSLLPEDFRKLMQSLKSVAEAVGREM